MSDFYGEIPLGGKRRTLKSIPSKRPIHEIANEIEEAYDDIGVEAAEVLTCLQVIEGVDDHSTDGRSGRQLVREFLGLSSGWQEAQGIALRAELRRHI